MGQQYDDDIKNKGFETSHNKSGVYVIVCVFTVQRQETIYKKECLKLCSTEEPQNPPNSEEVPITGLLRKSYPPPITKLYFLRVQYCSCNYFSHVLLNFILKVMLTVYLVTFYFTLSCHFPYSLLSFHYFLPKVIGMCSPGG